LTIVIIDNTMLSALLELQCTSLFSRLRAARNWHFVIPSIVVREALNRERVNGEDIHEIVDSIGVIREGDESARKELKSDFFKLGDGELEAFQIARQYDKTNADYILILDDNTARKVAQSLKLRVHGTLWALIELHKCGNMSKVELHSYLDGLKKVGFYFEPGIVASLMN
jgi:predicted nucleic acid-binding protein